MLVKVEFTGEEERNVVLHPHVDCVLDCRNLDVVCVGVVRSVDCVVEAQRPLFVGLIAEDESE